MKSFKKIFVVALFAMISSFAFADYDGDFQIRFGYSWGDFELTSASGKITTTTPGGGAISNTFTNADWQKWTEPKDRISQLSNFSMTLASYNTWMIVPKFFGLGFMYITEFDFGEVNDTASFNFNTIIGPAISTTLGSVVRLETGVGLNIGVGAYGSDKKITKNNITTTTTSANVLVGVGFGWDISAVFLPKAVFSPVVGFNLTTTVGGGIGTNITTTKSSSVASNMTYDFVGITTKYTIFIGGAFNFGRD